MYLFTKNEEPRLIYIPAYTKAITSLQYACINIAKHTFFFSETYLWNLKIIYSPDEIYVLHELLQSFLLELHLPW